MSQSQNRESTNDHVIPFDFKTPTHVLLEMLQYLVAGQQSIRQYDIQEDRLLGDLRMHAADRRAAARTAQMTGFGSDDLPSEETDRLCGWYDQLQADARRAAGASVGILNTRTEGSQDWYQRLYHTCIAQVAIDAIIAKLESLDDKPEEVQKALRAMNQPGSLRGLPYVVKGQGGWQKTLEMIEDL